MISMTGYAYREKTCDDFSLSAEIKSYNSRYLDINIFVPTWLSSLENKIREIITSNCVRGKIEFYIRIREFNVPVSVNVNANAALAYYKAINDLAVKLGMNEKPSLSTLLKMDGIIEIEKTRNDERYWQEIEPLLIETVKLFKSEREREGKHTEADILANLEIIETSLKIITEHAPVIENNIKDNIRQRFAELLGNQIDENRILAETAALLLKYTISEEISRLTSHLKEFRAEAERNSAPGKKCDFLSQEINREINTIGSKSAVIKVSAEVVKMKEALENIREQLRNVE